MARDLLGVGQHIFSQSEAGKQIISMSHHETQYRSEDKVFGNDKPQFHLIKIYIQHKLIYFINIVHIYMYFLYNVYMAHIQNSFVKLYIMC